MLGSLPSGALRSGLRARVTTRSAGSARGLLGVPWRVYLTEEETHGGLALSAHLMRGRGPDSPWEDLDLPQSPGGPGPPAAP